MGTVREGNQIPSEATHTSSVGAKVTHTSSAEAKVTHTSSVGAKVTNTLGEDTVVSGLSDDFAGFPPPAESACQGGPVAGSMNPDVGLDPTLLQALGVNPQITPPPAPPLHSSIAARWTHHLMNGLPSDTFSALREKYVVPSNLPQLNPPRLNPEIGVSVNSTHRTVDACYMGLQAQCATAITALGLGLTKLVEQGGDVSAIVGPSYEHICDAGRAMTALFYDINRIRRRLIQNVCSTVLTEISKNVPPSDLLFGDNLASRFSAHSGLATTVKGLVPLNRFPVNPSRQQQPQTSVSLQNRGPGNGRGRAALRGGQAQSKAKPQGPSQMGRTLQPAQRDFRRNKRRGQQWRH
ncbi:hypothetical protein GE061_003237 [Apolygus lucorum]|uniref:Uncharacterized protein n=1 Tax=Apolygus lucorum TaxID=248454 RepID=A0A8S9X1F8_APOLU|nr:hypothetical protein GE061_003237 [Apolygus lucorum]